MIWKALLELITMLTLLTAGVLLTAWQDNSAELRREKPAGVVPAPQILLIPKG